MTLETRKLQLKLAQDKGDKKLEAYWQARLDRSLPKPVKMDKPEPKDKHNGKKPKR